MNKITFIFFTFFIVLTSFCSCDSSAERNGKLQSNWIVHKAYRNGRVTSTMEKGFFRFWHLDSMETNILGETTKSTYIIQKNIIVTDSELPQFTVDNIGKDTLVLETKINKYRFSFTLIKSNK